MLSEATEREVHTGDGSIFIEECYTLGEAATALGKSRLTLKRWVEDELVPPPILMDTAYQYRQYSRRELQLIAQHLALHEAEHSYLHQGHTETINGMWQSVEAHRRSHVGE